MQPKAGISNVKNFEMNLSNDVIRRNIPRVIGLVCITLGDITDLSVDVLNFNYTVNRACGASVLDKDDHVTLLDHVVLRGLKEDNVTLIDLTRHTG